MPKPQGEPSTSTNATISLPGKQGTSSAVIEPAQQSDQARNNVEKESNVYGAQWLPSDASAMQAVVLVQTGAAPLHRLQPAERMPSGTQLFVPSASRPKFDLPSGPHWQVCGITHMILIQPDTSNPVVPVVDLRLGRALITASANGQSMQMSTPAGQFYLSLADPSSQVAMELGYSPQAHGAVTDRTAYPATLSIYVLSGSAKIDINGMSLSIPAGSKTSLVVGQTTLPEAAETPTWVDSSLERPVDQLAAGDLAKQLTNDQDVGATLHKLAANRRPEVRALAAQTLSLLGSWEWVTNPKCSLADSRDRTFWGPLIDRTRQILAAHPENAEALTASLSMLDAASAEWRTKLWLGLDAQQLQGDSLSKVVAGLESDVLLDRILSIQQLQRLTGKDLGYQAGEVNRQQAQQWHRELAGRMETLPVPKS